MDRPGPFQVRAKPETSALFDELHAELNRRRPLGSVTRGQTLDIIVASACVALREGRLHPTLPPKEINEPT